MYREPILAGAVSSIDGVTPDAMDDQTTFRAYDVLHAHRSSHERRIPDITTAQRLSSQSSQAELMSVQLEVRA
jgi:hypothetical protein